MSIQFLLFLSDLYVRLLTMQSAFVFTSFGCICWALVFGSSKIFSLYFCPYWKIDASGQLWKVIKIVPHPFLLKHVFNLWRYSMFRFVWDVTQIKCICLIHSSKCTRVDSEHLVSDQGDCKEDEKAFVVKLCYGNNFIRFLVRYQSDYIFQWYFYMHLLPANNRSIYNNFHIIINWANYPFCNSW